MRHYQTILTLLTLTTQVAFGQMKPDWKFRDELMTDIISQKDTIYIQDRHKLEKFSGLQSSDTTAIINYQTKTGDEISISVQTGKFESIKYKLHLTDKGNEPNTLIAVNQIDGKQAYGIDGEQPRTEIKELKAKWNDSWLAIPHSVFKNLYEIHTTTLEAYLSQNKKLIYLYFSASDGAGGYSIKFVFDKNGYVTRLISTNECTNGYDFIDALPTDCE